MTMEHDVEFNSIYKPMGRGVHVGDQGPCFWTYDVTTTSKESGRLTSNKLQEQTR